MIVIDEAMKVNGCLKVMVGSHLMGRLDHGHVGNQHGADLERTEALESRLPVRYVEAKPGSVLFLHCNLLHTSEANLSKFPRLAYICCYNAFSNIPILGAGHGPPVPIQLAQPTTQSSNSPEAMSANIPLKTEFFLEISIFKNGLEQPAISKSPIFPLTAIGRVNNDQPTA